MTENVELMGGIFDAFLRIRHEFQRAHMKVPSIIILEDHDEGMRLLGVVHKHLLVYMPKPPEPIHHPDGSVYMEVEVVGIKVRWPANRIALQSGGYRFV